MPGNSMAEAEQRVARISAPAYAMDDETAINMVNGTAEVVSEGHWMRAENMTTTQASAPQPPSSHAQQAPCENRPAMVQIQPRKSGGSAMDRS